MLLDADQTVSSKCDRFSEEQVVRWPRSCCKAIALVLAQVTGDGSMLNQFAYAPDL